MRRIAAFQDTDDDLDPLAGIANLFDVAMVFAVALLVAVVSYMRLGDILTQDEVTVVKNPGKPTMEIVKKSGRKIARYKASGFTAQAGERGRKIGSAYELEDGEVIYVPEGED